MCINALHQLASASMSATAKNLGAFASKSPSSMPPIVSFYQE